MFGHLITRRRTRRTASLSDGRTAHRHDTTSWSDANVREVSRSRLFSVNGGAIIDRTIWEKEDLERLIHKHAAQIRQGVSHELLDPAVIVD